MVFRENEQGESHHGTVGLFPLSCGVRAASSLLLLSAFSLSSAQQVIAWGDAPTPPAEVGSGVKSVTSGGLHVLALKRDGSVVAWGNNVYGQCDVPAQAGSGVAAVAAGVYHSLALRADGSVVAWGWNAVGQCNVPASALSGVAALAAGGSVSVALKGNGSVLAWGNNQSGQCNVPSSLSGVVSVATGGSHVLALKSDGGVVAWGLNSNGQCDVPSTARSGVVAVAAGTTFSLALKANGSMVAWGTIGENSASVPDAAMSGVVSIAAGSYHALATKNDGSVVSWGFNGNGQTTVPDLAQGGVLSCSGGARASVALRAEAWLKSPEIIWANVGLPGIVYLSQPAGVGGTTVGIVGDDPHLEVPLSVTVPEGATQAGFLINNPPAFGPERTVTLQTSYRGTDTVPSSMIRRNFLATLTANRPNVIGGSTTSAKVTLSIPGSALSLLTLDLASSDPAVKVPSTITLGEGIGEFLDIPLVHGIVPTDRGVKITASYQGKQVAIASIGIKAMGATVELGSPKVISGDGTFGVMTLSAAVATPLTVALGSGDPAVSVPTAVTVNAGSRIAYFSVSTNPVAQNTVVPITATVGTRTFSGNLELAPAAAVSSLTLPKFVYGNNKAAGTVVISRAAPAGGFVVSLASDANLSVPATVTVPEGATRVNFDAVGADLANVANATVTATGRLGTANATIEVRPLVLTSLSLSDVKVKGGGNVTGTVTLNVPVGVDTVVSLASDSSFATVPATVTIPAGSSSATFTVGTKATTAAVQATITATKGTKSLSKALKVQP